MLGNLVNENVVSNSQRRKTRDECWQHSKTESLRPTKKSLAEIQEKIERSFCFKVGSGTTGKHFKQKGRKTLNKKRLLPTFDQKLIAGFYF